MCRCHRKFSGWRFDTLVANQLNMIMSSRCIYFGGDLFWYSEGVAFCEIYFNNYNFLFAYLEVETYQESRCICMRSSNILMILNLNYQKSQDFLCTKRCTKYFQKAYTSISLYKSSVRSKPE